MYIGRIVSVAKTPDNRIVASYRVSSRSFPNRKAVISGDKVSIVPKDGHEGDIFKNPYIAYNCVRLVNNGDIAVVTNGSQTDPIAEKIAMGMPIRDALVLSSLAMDYEKDDYNTPRISAVADRVNNTGWLAVVRDNGLEVREMPLEAGQFFYVSTYEENTLEIAQGGDYTANTSEEACEFILSKSVFAERTNPVTAVAAVLTDGAFELTSQDVVTD